MKKAIDRVMAILGILGFLAMAFGACCFDSEKLLVPSLMVIGGSITMLLVSRFYFRMR